MKTPRRRLLLIITEPFIKVMKLRAVKSQGRVLTKRAWRLITGKTVEAARAAWIGIGMSR
jgi:hypothetical protein